MKVNSQVGCYYDTDGHVAVIVHSDDPDYDVSVHDSSWPRYVRLNMPPDVYESLPPAVLVNGVAHHYHITKWHVEQEGWKAFTDAHPVIAQAVLDRIKAVATHFAKSNVVL